MALLCSRCSVRHGPHRRPSPSIEQLDEAMRLKDRGQASQAEALLESLLLSLESGPPSVELGRVLNSLSQVSSSQGSTTSRRCSHEKRK